MVEAMAIGVVVSLLQQAIPAALSKLKAKIQQAKATEGELQGLEEFLSCVRDCSTKYETISGGTVKTTTLTSTTPSSLAKTLDEVQKTLDRWSRRNSGFLSQSSSDREKELRELRRKVDSAINVEILSMFKDQQRMLVSICVRVRNIDVHAQIINPPPIGTVPPVDDPHDHTAATARIDALTTCQLTTVTTTTSKISTELVRSKSTGRASTNPSSPPVFLRLRSKSVERDRPRSNETLRTVELWVPLDSEKQVSDMEKALKRLGVKRVSLDAFTKKVSVVLEEGCNDDIATLLRAIQGAQHKGKLPPTPWSDRPR